MALYHPVYRDDDDERRVRENLELDDVQREDGWVELRRGNDAIMRLQEKHVVSLERLD
jgi:hypothetical protein